MHLLRPAERQIDHLAQCALRAAISIARIIASAISHCRRENLTLPMVAWFLWNNGSISGAGAISLGSGTFRMAGSIQPYNSVRGETVDGGQYLGFAYDSVRGRLVVGRPTENIVTIFTMEQIFFDAFE